MDVDGCSGVSVEVGVSVDSGVRVDATVRGELGAWGACCVSGVSLQAVSSAMRMATQSAVGVNGLNAAFMVHGPSFQRFVLCRAVLSVLLSGNVVHPLICFE